MYKKGAKAIIRPPRAKYDPNKIPTISEIPGFGNVERTSIAFQNPSGETLLGSFYRAPEPFEDSCVVYLHGNASNQLEGRYIISLFVPLGVSVFCFDFAGCGCSTGKYISMGHREKDDVATVLEILRTDFHIQKVALWGRSMGAAVSLLCVGDDELGVVAAVLDSPYASLKDLVWDIGAEHVPKWLCKRAMKNVREIVRKKASFDIYEVEPASACEHCQKPLFFIHAEDDALVKKSNSIELFSSAPSQDKKLYIVDGKHNSDRPSAVLLRATEFLCRALGLIVEFDSDASCEQNSFQHFSDAESLLNHV